MLDILEFIFQDPYHYFGFIFLWWCTIGAIRIHLDSPQKESKGGKDDVDVPNA